MRRRIGGAGERCEGREERSLGRRWVVFFPSFPLPPFYKDDDGDVDKRESEREGVEEDGVGGAKKA